MTSATATFTLETFGYKVTQLERYQWRIKGLGEDVTVGEIQFIDIARATPDKPFHELQANEQLMQKYKSPIKKVLE